VFAPYDDDLIGVACFHKEFPFLLFSAVFGEIEVDNKLVVLPTGS